MELCEIRRDGEIGESLSSYFERVETRHENAVLRGERGRGGGEEGGETIVQLIENSLEGVERCLLLEERIGAFLR